MREDDDRLPTAERAFEQALHDHLNGDWPAAQAKYHALLAAEPTHAGALHFLGVLLHQQGDLDEGRALVQRSLQLAPQHADWHNTWGNMLAAQRRDDDAAAAFMEALQRDARNADAWNNLGAVLLRTGRAQDAVTALRNAVELRPAFRAAHQHLSEAYRELGDARSAALSACAEYVLRPKEATLRDMLGIAYAQLGLHDEAAGVYAAWLKDEPGHPVASHLLQACRGQADGDRVPADFLQHYFDGYAESFESKLVDGLEYSVPQALQRLLADRAVAAHSLRVLDAGCGTGLCGVQLRPFAAHLSGVDLSGKSLERARMKAVYDSLHQQDIVEHLRALPPSCCDLIVAADVLIYFGDLAPFMAAAHAALAPGGLLMATTETLRGADAVMEGQALPGPQVPQVPSGLEVRNAGASSAPHHRPGFALQASGGYGHDDGYVLRTSSAAGFTVDTAAPLALRSELARPVAGLLVVARKTG